MKKFRISINMFLIILLVSIITVITGIYGFYSYDQNSNRQWSMLREQLSSQSDYLAAMLVLPVWNFDNDQIVNEVESIMKNPNIFGISIDLLGGESKSVIREKDDQGRIMVSKTINYTSDMIIEKRNIMYEDNLIGRMTLFGSPKLLKGDLRETFIYLFGETVILDLFLILALFLLLKQFIFTPIKKMEAYAMGINGIDDKTHELDKIHSIGELENLRVSISRMVKLLNARYSDILILNKELENKVEERTKELYSANEELLAMNEELQAMNEEVNEMNTQLENEIEEKNRVELEIKMLNSQLENKVMERTRELSSANDHLEQTNIMLEAEINHHNQALAQLTIAKELAESANLAKSQFLANMSHEIRTPMNGIMGMTELVLMTDTDQEQKEYLHLIKKSSDVLMQIINDVLDYSKIEANKIVIDQLPYNIKETIKEVIAMFNISAKQKGLEMDVELGAEIPAVVIGDVVRLRQVLSNLISNSIKFTYTGSIKVIVALKSQTVDKSEILISVKDTGIGIPMEQRDMLFKRFSQLDSSYTKEFQGTGLGLAISKRLVELMDGDIWIEDTGSSEETGSTFKFTIVVKKQ